MNHTEFFNKAVSIIEQRDDDYGSPLATMQNIADLFDRITGVKLTDWHVAMLLHCVKLARLRTAPGKQDNYLDGVNYLGFAALAAESKKGSVGADADAIPVPGIDWTRGRD